MPSLLPRSKKARTALIVIASIAVIAIVATLLANTGGSGKKKVGTTTKPTAKAPHTTSALKLAVGTVKVQSTGTDTKLPSPVRRAVMGAAQTYVDDAVLAPLTSGHVNDGYDKIFGLSLRPAASGPDRGALTEAATGAARGAVQTTASRVRIDGLGDPTGKVALVATTFTMTVKATTPAGAVTIHRNTALTFEDQFGRWVVTAYEIGVLRTVGATTSAAHASTTDGTSRLGAAT